MATRKERRKAKQLEGRNPPIKLPAEPKLETVFKETDIPVPFNKIVDLRQHDKAACDQIYPDVALWMTERLWAKHGPTFEGSSRIWDMVYMSSITRTETETENGVVFPLVVEGGKDDEGITIRLRLCSLGGDVCCFDLID